MPPISPLVTFESLRCCAPSITSIYKKTDERTNHPATRRTPDLQAIPVMSYLKQPQSRVCVQRQQKRSPRSIFLLHDLHPIERRSCLCSILHAVAACCIHKSESSCTGLAAPSLPALSLLSSEAKLGLYPTEVTLRYASHLQCLSLVGTVALIMPGIPTAAGIVNGAPPPPVIPSPTAPPSSVFSSAISSESSPQLPPQLPGVLSVSCCHGAETPTRSGTPAVAAALWGGPPAPLPPPPLRTERVRSLAGSSCPPAPAAAGVGEGNVGGGQSPPFRPSPPNTVGGHRSPAKFSTSPLAAAAGATATLCVDTESGKEPLLVGKQLPVTAAVWIPPRLAPS